MNYWFEWDELVEYYHNRFGVFHMCDLTDLNSLLFNHIAQHIGGYSLVGVAMNIQFRDI